MASIVTNVDTTTTTTTPSKVNKNFESKDSISSTINQRRMSSVKVPAPKDFLFGKVLGEGAYAKVIHARRKNNGVDYAAKIMDKSFIKKHGKIESVARESKLLRSFEHPNIIRLYCAFKSTECLFLISELCHAGELKEYIDVFKAKSTVKDKAMDLVHARFYLGETINAVQYLHDRNILHRDLKPENILISQTGHVKLVDFGTALDLSNAKHSRVAFVGTAEYVSPEVLKDEPVTKGSDIWAIGCILFQMLTGRPPFRGESEYLTFQQISEYVEHTFLYPDVLNQESKAIISSFLNKDTNKRLGSGAPDSEYGYPALRKHPFFFINSSSDVNSNSNGSTKGSFVWEKLYEQNAPSIPTLIKLEDPTKDGATLNFSLFDIEDELEGMSISSVNNNNNNGMKKKAALGIHRKSSVEEDFIGFLMPGETIFHSGTLVKRRYFSVKTRFFMLITGNAEPRLIYIDAEKKDLKGEIPWSNEIETAVISPFKFDIITAERTYHLSSEKEDYILGWVQAIEDAKKM